VNFLDFSPPHLRPTWVEIDLDAVIHNVREFRKLTGSNMNIMAVVKADAYGHGAPEVSRAAIEGGADYLGVAFLEEGIELRKAGLEAPILLLGYTPPPQMEKMIDYRLTPTIFSLETARYLSQCARKREENIPVHVKVDTGMGRIGFLPGMAAELVEEISRLPGLKIEGLMSHFAAADEEDPEYTYSQLESFRSIHEECCNRGIEPSLLHASNSAGTIRFPEAHFDMVRLGLALYGYYPSEAVNYPERVDLRPVLFFKSRVIMSKQVPAGTCLSYGATYCTDQPSVIATIPVGYADGFNRLLSNRGKVLINGIRVPVVGRVCMDYIMADVTAIEGVKEGEEVVLYGPQGNERVTVAEVADLLGTIPYEVLCSVSKRVPRWYYRYGKVVAYSDLLGKKEID